MLNFIFYVKKNAFDTYQIMKIKRKDDLLFHVFQQKHYDINYHPNYLVSRLGESNSNHIYVRDLNKQDEEIYFKDNKFTFMGENLEEGIFNYLI